MNSQCWWKTKEDPLVKLCWKARMEPCWRPPTRPWEKLTKRGSTTSSLISSWGMNTLASTLLEKGLELMIRGSEDSGNRYFFDNLSTKNIVLLPFITLCRTFKSWISMGIFVPNCLLKEVEFYNENYFDFRHFQLLHHGLSIGFGFIMMKLETSWRLREEELMQPPRQSFNGIFQKFLGTESLTHSFISWAWAISKWFKNQSKIKVFSDWLRKYLWKSK